MAVQWNIITNLFFEMSYGILLDLIRFGCHEQLDCVVESDTFLMWPIHEFLIQTIWIRAKQKQKFPENFPFVKICIEWNVLHVVQLRWNIFFSILRMSFDLFIWLCTILLTARWYLWKCFTHHLCRRIHFLFDLDNFSLVFVARMHFNWQEDISVVRDDLFVCFFSHFFLRAATTQEYIRLYNIYMYFYIYIRRMTLTVFKDFT